MSSQEIYSTGRPCCQIDCGSTYRTKNRNDQSFNTVFDATISTHRVKARDLSIRVRLAHTHNADPSTDRRTEPCDASERNAYAC